MPKRAQYARFSGECGSGGSDLYGSGGSDLYACTMYLYSTGAAAVICAVLLYYYYILVPISAMAGVLRSTLKWRFGVILAQLRSMG